ncbi:MAG: hypothetical protein QG633_346 [Patescibacteria group bacterium]|nr:hypothetical protein [Patescibacteria group bacterium]
MGFSSNFRTVYSNLYKLHPQLDNEEFRFRYLRVDWFFPQHINNVLEQIKRLGTKYFPEVDLEVALFAGLMHDAGLVYNRETSSPLGHEQRSEEYARRELSALSYSEEFIGRVCECIKATEPAYQASSPEALLVRNADAYAHMISMHFFAKSNFSKDIASFVDWFSDKLKTTHSKITIPELREELKPTVSFYESLIENYRRNRDIEDYCV